MNTFISILNIVPALLRVIVSVEECFPQAGAGKEKLGMVKDIMTAAYSGIASLLPAIEQIVTVVVSFANSIGAFKRSE